MLSIHYFASVREQLGRASQQLELTDEVKTVADLIALLSRLEPKFDQMIKTRSSILVSVNQVVADKSYVLSEEDEVAFFPPMTGG